MGTTVFYSGDLEFDSWYGGGISLSVYVALLRSSRQNWLWPLLYQIICTHHSVILPLIDM
jgi:hypothetical protein